MGLLERWPLCERAWLVVLRPYAISITCSYQSDSVASTWRGLEKAVSIEIRELPDFVNPSPMMFLLIKYWKKISEGAATLSLNYLEKIRSPGIDHSEKHHVAEAH